MFTPTTVSLVLAIVAVIALVAVVLFVALRRCRQHGWLISVPSEKRWYFVTSEHEAIRVLWEGGVNLRGFNNIHSLIVPPGGFPDPDKKSPDVYPNASAKDIIKEYCDRLSRGYKILEQMSLGNTKFSVMRATRSTVTGSVSVPNLFNRRVTVLARDEVIVA